LNEYLENFPEDCLSGNQADCLSGNQATLVRVMEINAIFLETQEGEIRLLGV